MVREIEDDGTTDDEPGVRARDLIHLAPAFVLVVVLVVFSLANTQRTRVDLVVTDVRAPLVLVLLATAVLGALISALVRFRRRHSR